VSRVYSPLKCEMDFQSVNVAIANETSETIISNRGDRIYSNCLRARTFEPIARASGSRLRDMPVTDVQVIHQGERLVARVDKVSGVATATEPSYVTDFGQARVARMSAESGEIMRRPFAT
jgi:hypothetical protein